MEWFGISEHKISNIKPVLTILQDGAKQKYFLEIRMHVKRKLISTLPIYTVTPSFNSN